ncbi:hypothetical protein GQ42DRAFT_172050 [Ramicandelaber brevisporus]|nr:hypothetical protein GQ42DRAFT_172050 [Ramicandelaber brevisporus]
MKLITIGVIFLAGIVASSIAATAHFEFSLPNVSTNTLIFQLTSDTLIVQARDILSGKEKEYVHVMGKIVKSKADYNPKWSYHIDPNTVKFFSKTMEACDASIEYVEDHLQQACGSFLPDCAWCPWTSKLLREVPAAEIKN